MTTLTKSSLSSSLESQSSPWCISQAGSSKIRMTPSEMLASFSSYLVFSLLSFWTPITATRSTTSEQTNAVIKMWPLWIRRISSYLITLCVYLSRSWAILWLQIPLSVAKQGTIITKWTSSYYLWIHLFTICGLSASQTTPPSITVRSNAIFGMFKSFMEWASSS